MDLSDFMDGEGPMSYKKARKYFAQDPAQKWAAYIAGTILVLMKELGVRFEDSISLLVCKTNCFNFSHKVFSKRKHEMQDSNMLAYYVNSLFILVNNVRICVLGL